MEKKKYICPAANETSLLLSKVLCGSDVTSGNGIGYGGTDEDGSIDPAVRRKDFSWESDFYWYYDE